MPSLLFDGNKKVIYEVPVDGASSFVTDGNGYRIYTPNVIGTAPTLITFTVFDLWSRAVDFLDNNKWAELVFALTGGAFRYTDASGDVYALPDIRFINDWAYVPANYPHIPLIVGNLYPNIASGIDFDTSRITAQGVSPRIQFSDRGERTILGGNDAAITGADKLEIAELTRDTILSTEIFP